MKLKRIAGVTFSALVICGMLIAGIYYALTRDPTPIKVDPQLYDNYAGYYDFGHGYILAGLREFGMIVKPISLTDGHMARGYWVGIQIDPATRNMKGGVSRGVEGQVVGY